MCISNRPSQPKLFRRGGGATRCHCGSCCHGYKWLQKSISKDNRTVLWKFLFVTESIELLQHSSRFLILELWSISFGHPSIQLNKLFLQFSKLILASWFPFGHEALNCTPEPPCTSSVCETDTLKLSHFLFSRKTPCKIHVHFAISSHYYLCHMGIHNFLIISFLPALRFYFLPIWYLVSFRSFEQCLCSHTARHKFLCTCVLDVKYLYYSNF